MLPVTLLKNRELEVVKGGTTFVSFTLWITGPSFLNCDPKSVEDEWLNAQTCPRHMKVWKLTVAAESFGSLSSLPQTPFSSFSFSFLGVCGEDIFLSYFHSQDCFFLLLQSCVNERERNESRNR